MHEEYFAVLQISVSVMKVNVMILLSCKVHKCFQELQGDQKHNCNEFAGSRWSSPAVIRAVGALV
jgi:hypothetical protein